MTLLLLTVGPLVYGQASGFNFSVGYGPALVTSPLAASHPSVVFGIAFQHDFDQRFGVALDFFHDVDDSHLHSNDWIYSAKYFLSDNDESAFYFGTFFGFQHLTGTVTDYSSSNVSGMYPTSTVSKMQFPFGVRAGVRGGMGGYFAELFGQAGYALGNGGLYYSEGTRMNSSSVYYTLGLSFIGFGWEHSRGH